MINARKTMLPERLAATAVFEIPFFMAEVTALIILSFFYSYKGYCYCFEVCFCGPPINIPTAPAIVIIIPMSWIYFHG